MVYGMDGRRRAHQRENLHRFYLGGNLCERENLNRHRVEAIWGLACERLNGTAGPRILEYGCNIGFGIRRLAELGLSCVGADIWKEGIEFACARNPFPNLQLVVIEDALPFPDSFFDFVFSSEVLEHVPVAKRESYFREFRRVIKKTGIGYISFPNFWFPLEMHYRIPFYHWWHKLAPASTLVYEDIPSKYIARRMLRRHFVLVDVTREFLESAYVKRRFGMLERTITKLLSKTPFKIQEHLILVPR